MPLLLAVGSPVGAGDDGKRTGDDGGDGRSGPAMTRKWSGMTDGSVPGMTGKGAGQDGEVVGHDGEIPGQAGDDGDDENRPSLPA